MRFIAILVLGICTAVTHGQTYPAVSPFSAIRFVDDGHEPGVHVEVQGTWYRLRSIDGVSTADLLAHCRTAYGGKARKRFGEDLVQVLSEMGHPPGHAVDLVLDDSATGRRIEMAGVLMTPENRRKIRDAERLLSRAEAEADLEELASYLDDQHSYVAVRDVDLEEAFADIREDIGEMIGVDDFAIRIQKLIARLGDGHAGVEGFESHLPAGCASFLAGDAGGRLVAFDADRTSLLDDAHPYLVAIDGVAVDRWLAAAAAVVPDGSPQLVRARAIRGLRLYRFLCAELGVQPGDEIAVTLADEAGAATRVLTLPVQRIKPLYGRWPRRASAILDGNIGYLRVETMQRSAALGTVTPMQRLRDTRGLVIDARGSGGGSRLALRLLFPYFMPPDAPPHVANVAAYRLGRPFDDDHLESRFMYTADDPVWTAAQRAAIRAVAETFEPEWSPPPGRFSAWHYFVLERRLNPDAYHYDKPVVVLMDSDCFSAKDILLGVFKGWPNVTLLGTASAGGSGCKQTVRLRNSGLSLSLSSMASYRPGGQLYDGRGIEPDVVVYPGPRYFTGTTDAQLDAAVRTLRQPSR